MNLARIALILALMLPAMVRAEGLYDTHFKGGFCFLRQYGPPHFVKHPEQRVRSILLAPVPLSAPPGSC